MTPEIAQAKFHQFSRGIAAEFLQTVLVVDDKAKTSNKDIVDESKKPTQAVSPGRRGVAIAPSKEGNDSSLQKAENTKAAPQQEIKTDDEILPIKDLNQSFAEKGIICGFLSPESTGGDREIIIRAAEASAKRADIIILDWKMEGGDKVGREDGYTALRIIKTILANDEGTEGEFQSNGRLRLISIYSQSDDLKSIMNSVESTLKTNFSEMILDREDDFTLSQTSTRICAFKKSGIKRDATDPLSARTFEVEQLTDRLIDEFTELTKGLLSNVAIAALSSLRANTHKILQKFNSDLDAPYLTHRALSGPPEETQSHPIALLASEMHDVLEGHNVIKAVSPEQIELWINSLAHTAGPNTLGVTPTDLPGFLANTVIHGVNHENKNAQWVSFTGQVKKKKGHNKLTDLMLGNTGKQKDEEFSILTTIRSHYNAPPPYLTLGTIISIGDENNRQYYVCIQPVCDCVRIKDSRKFPFLKLQPPVNGTFDLVIKDKTKFVELKVNYKPYDVDLFNFKAKGGQIKAEDKGKNNWLFEGVDAANNKVSCQWVADLKFAHAQRIAEQFGGQISRVGLMESEWLRRMGIDASK